MPTTDPQQPPSGYPLAPPLAGPPAAPTPDGAPPYAPPLPPYAAQPATGDPTGYPAPAPGVPAMPPRRRGGPTGVIVALLAALVVIVLLGAGLFLARSVFAAPDPAPHPAAADPDQDSDPAPDPVDPSDDSRAEIALERMFDEYARDRRDGSLWEKIPDTEFNRTAVQAFLILLTDMRVALRWDAGDGDEYLERAADLEQRLLSQQPLGDDIHLENGEGRVFEYDGTTGEGGYVEE